MEVRRLQTPKRLAGMLATIVPTATGNLVLGPSDQDAGRHTCGRPEHGDVIRFGKQQKAQP